jgi:hypothetical protein
MTCGLYLCSKAHRREVLVRDPEWRQAAAPDCSSPTFGQPPAHDPPRHQFARHLVPQALSRAPAEERQPIGANVILAQHLNEASGQWISVSSEISKALGAGDQFQPLALNVGRGGSKLSTQSCGPLCADR